ncbi:hypothetical protein AB0M02_41055 [Actinoplanes sp. NPDC051861]|uniref:hypothetical protein n=1 Tax=Actinoplanes sp. NPDC051861 TaxID=3155170 RepID=UPI00343888C4
MRRRPADLATARLLAAVDSESRPYTDPRAQYPRAEDYRRTVTEGAARRQPAA